MVTIEKKRKYTTADYLLLEEGAPFQLINHDLIMSPSPLPFNQVISARITHAMMVFIDEKSNDGFIVNAPIDVRFDDGNILQPDVLFIAAKRKANLIKDRIEGAPDLIIEILSPSNAYYDLRQKKDIYEKYGVKEYIIIDPIAKNADLYALREGAYYLHQKAGNKQYLDSLILPGLSFDLNKIFKI